MYPEILWTFDPKVPRARARTICCDVVNRGVALDNGKVYLATLDGRLIALDAKPGKPVWDVITVVASVRLDRRKMDIQLIADEQNQNRAKCG